MISESEKSKIKRILFAKNPVTEYFEEFNYLENSVCAFFDADNIAFADCYAGTDITGYLVVPLADYQKMSILNSDALKCEKNGEKYLPTRIVQCVDFDSNIVSDIYKLFNGKELKNKKEFLEFLVSIKKEKVQISAIPYILECEYNCKILDKNIVYKNLLYFFMFDSLSLEQLKKDNISHISPCIENYILADEAWNKISINSNEKLFDKYFVIYCMLCKTFLIKVCNKKGYENKVSELVDFMNNELYAYLEFEFSICCLFLKNDDRLAHFFRLLKPNRKDITGDIKNMTWDILHIRNIQTEMAIRSTIKNNQNIFYAHYIASHDKGLIDILKSNPIKRIAFYKGFAYPKYEKNLDEICKNSNIKAAFYDDTFQREKYCLSYQNSYLNDLASKLERLVFNLESCKN